jgi:hypothetical protein
MKFIGQSRKHEMTAMTIDQQDCRQKLFCCWLFVSVTLIRYLIRPCEVFNKLSHINLRKAASPDDTPSWILRNFAFVIGLIAEPVSHANSSVQHGTVKRVWKKPNAVM